MLCIAVANAQLPIATFPSITATQAMGNKLFFTAQSDTYGAELFVSDGRTGNYTLVKDINPGHPGSTPSQFTVFNDLLFFVAYSEQYGQSLWKTDGTSEGTQLVYSVQYAEPYYLTVFKDKLYFTTNLGAIVQTDGSVAGTKVYYQSDYTWGRIMTMVKSENFLYFSPEGRTFYRDNGTSRIEFLAPLSWEDVSFRRFLPIANKLVVVKASSYESMVRIYSIDEAAIGDNVEDEWTLIKKIDAPAYGSQALENFTNVNGKVIFSLRKNFDDEVADELWISDGTEIGTKAVKSFSWDPHWYQSESRSFFEFKGKVYFRSGKAQNFSLWTSDGTSEGTAKVHDVMLKPDAAAVTAIATKEKFYFSGENSGQTGVWSSDGTTAGTQLLLDMTDQSGSINYLTLSDNQIFFVTSQQFSGRLWSGSPAPKLSVRTQWGEAIPSGSKPNFFFAPPLGSCPGMDLIIENKGTQELYLRSIVVSGTDFYLKKETLPDVILPGESAKVTLVFNTLKNTISQGELTILSNDLINGKYTLSLQAAPVDQSSEICEFSVSDFVKTLDAQTGASTLALSNSSVEEGKPSGSIVGELSFLNETNVAYQLVDGEGGADNGNFLLEGKLLKTNAVFDFDARSLYTIRVKAVTENTEVESSFRISIQNQSLPLSSGTCEPHFEKTSFSYNDMEANNQGHLFATTTNGEILRSLDLGTTWEVVYRGVNELSRIVFKNNIGLVESNLFLLKSEDNGVSWFPVHVPLTGTYYFGHLSQFFLDDKRGFVGAGEGEILYTSDGGQNWQIRTDDLGEEIRRLFFVSENKGYAVLTNGQLMRTSDGARSWSNVNLGDLGWGANAYDVWFLDEQRGFFVGTYGLYMTLNGGVNWGKVSDVYTSEIPRIKFTDANDGFVFGSAGLVYRTSNGGATWEQVVAYNLSGPITGVAKTSSRLFVCSRGYYHYQSGRAINMSSDNGVTWTLLDNFSESHIHKISFSGNDKGFVIGQNGVFTTLNDGRTWQQASLNLTNVGDIHFIDDNTIIFLSEGNIYKTTDGGATVRNVLTTSKEDPYVPAGKLYGFPGDVLFSISWYAVYRSDDLGETWDLISTDVGYYTQGMHFISTDIGYRIELFGSVEKTVDGGKTWLPIFTREPDASDAFNAIFFVNENLGFAGGEHLMKSVDGGKTWSRIWWPLADIIAIHFESENHGYVVSRGGRVEETLDGGKTWATIYYASSNVYSAQFANDQIHLAGENGMMARLKTAPVAPGIAGYITGPEKVCAGDAITFNLAVDYGTQTQWSTTGGEFVQEQDNQVTIRFTSPGQYSVSATHFNSCASGAVRSKNIVVSPAGETLVITGPNPSTAGEENVVYTLDQNSSDLVLVWDVNGASGTPQVVSGGVEIDWPSDGEEGIIRVLAVNGSGCRAFGTLQVVLEKQELPVAVEKTLETTITLYPNPSPANTTIKSLHQGMLLVRILDVKGREVALLYLESGQERTIPAQQLKPGFYLLEISDGKRKITKKFIKE